MATFFPSEKGGIVLLLDGYRYHLASSGPQCCTWRCVNKKNCKGSIVTVGAEIDLTTESPHTNDCGEAALKIENLGKALKAIIAANASSIGLPPCKLLDDLASSLFDNRSASQSIGRKNRRQKQQDRQDAEPNAKQRLRNEHLQAQFYANYNNNSNETHCQSGGFWEPQTQQMSDQRVTRQRPELPAIPGPAVHEQHQMQQEDIAAWHQNPGCSIYPQNSLHAMTNQDYGIQNEVSLEANGLVSQNPHKLVLPPDPYVDYSQQHVMSLPYRPNMLQNETTETWSNHWTTHQPAQQQGNDNRNEPDSHASYHPNQSNPNGYGSVSTTSTYAATHYAEDCAPQQINDMSQQQTSQSLPPHGYDQPGHNYPFQPAHAAQQLECRVNLGNYSQNEVR